MGVSFSDNDIQVGRVAVLSTDADTHFTGALNPGTISNINLTGLIGNRAIIRGIALQSALPIDYRVMFWSKDTFDDPDGDVDSFIGSYRFGTPQPADRLAGANQYYQNAEGLGLLYQDDDGTNKVHVGIQNLNATGAGGTKTAGTPGFVRITFKYEPR